MHLIKSYWSIYKYFILVSFIPVLGVVFLFIPEEVTITVEGYKVYVTHQMFPLTKSQCTWQEYTYYGCEHLQFIIVSYIAFSLSKKANFLINLSRNLMCYLIIDAFDYFLTYNEVWYYWAGIPMSFNTTGWIIIVIFTLFYKGKNGSNYRHSDL